MQHGNPPMEAQNNQVDAADNEEDKENAVAFSFIVTRPTVLLKDGPSTKKLSASKSVRCSYFLHLLIISL